MKVIDDWGVLVKMTDRDYLRYLRAGAEGKDPDSKDFGGRRIGEITFHTVDRTTRDYQDELNAETRRVAETRRRKKGA